MDMTCRRRHVVTCNTCPTFLLAPAPSLYIDASASVASPSQVISHLYEDYGEQVAGMLDGMFSFVILDKNTNSFYAARDPIGITSLYIGWGKDGSLWVSSEMKCIKEDCAR